MKTKTRIMLPLLFSIFSASTVMAQEGEGAPTTPSRPITSRLPVTPFTPQTMDLLAVAFGSPVAPGHDTRSAASMAAFLAHGDDDEADWLTGLTDTGPVGAPGATSAASASSGPSAAFSGASSTSASSEEDPLFSAIFGASEPEEDTAGLPSLDGEVMSPSRPALAASGAKINNRIRFGKVFDRALKRTDPSPSSHDYDLRNKRSKNG
jgi:hypothetical protein